MPANKALQPTHSLRFATAAGRLSLGVTREKSMKRVLAMIAAALFASCVTAPSQSFRWEINQPFATFKGTPTEQQSQVDAVLSNTARIDSMTMFIAADTAYALNRFEDSGFLFNAASIRGAFDFDRYPPVGSGGDSPAVYLGFLKSNAGQEINPKLTEDPKFYIGVASRLAAWDCNVISGYKPGWNYRSVISSSDSCEKIRDERAGPMQGIAKLLTNSEYATAFQVAKKYNLMPYKEQEAHPEAKAMRDKAFDKMLDIEKSTGIKGFAGYSR